MGQTTDSRSTLRLEDISSEGSRGMDRIDRVVVESPLTITVGGEVVATTMRTPGHDLDLVAGWLASEAGVRRPDDIVTLTALSASPRAAGGFGIEADDEPVSGEHDDAGARSGARGRQEIDTVRVQLAEGIEPPRPRAYVTSSSCGVCSADMLDESPAPSAPLHSRDWRVQPQQALDLIGQMRSRQRMFDLTGALHAAALVGPEFEVLHVREDVGRHNAVDKVIGRALMDNRLPLTDHVLVVSGRVSYEIVTKALSACIGAIVAVSGPTTLAVDVARRHGLVLIGFAREDRMNVYVGGERIAT